MNQSAIIIPFVIIFIYFIEPIHHWELNLHKSVEISSSKSIFKEQIMICSFSYADLILREYTVDQI